MNRSLCPLALLALLGCAAERRDPAPAAAGSLVDPCAAALASLPGATREDREIARVQEEARHARDPSQLLERLGWLLVARARATGDEGLYQVARQSALCLLRRRPGSPDALLLEGHVLHQMHRFRDAEEAARRLVRERGGPFDFGLLGDVQMEQGRLDEAIDSYQRMLDLKPCLQSMSRAAHVCWLKGDRARALELIRAAAGAGSRRDPESLAWVHARRALWELEAGSETEALAAAAEALSLVPDYAPALLARGRVLLGAGRDTEAIGALRPAADQRPLPEYLWTLAEALRSAHRIEEAARVEAELLRSGAAADPRTFALFLASTGRDAGEAVRLARAELANRSDVFTHDALAWALAAAGRLEEARPHAEHALSEGTRDARLLYHGGALAAAAGRREDARRLFLEAATLERLLLPSERADLERRRAAL
jgi:tetratricopeptide (TPR) repeat protein